MRKLIIGLIMFLLLLAAIGCSNDTQNSSQIPNDSITKEPEKSSEEKEAQLAEEKAKAERELIEKAMLKKSISSWIEKCSEHDDELNNTFCFAEHGVMLMKQAKTEDNPHPVFNKEHHPVYNLCEYANNSDLCYFYAAVMLKAPGYCDKVEDKTGCELLSSMFCQRMINPNQCLLNKATLIRFISRSAAQSICNEMENYKNFPFAEEYTCDEIDFEEAEYDSEPLRNRFLLMYIMTGLNDFEVNKTTIRDYIREKREKNEQE